MHKALSLLALGTPTNWIRNCSTVGAIAGSPGTQPTNWIATNPAANGVTRTIAITSESGIDKISFRFAGTPSATSSVAIRTDAATAITAIAGDTVNFSIFHKLASGALTNIGAPTLTILGVQADGSTLAETGNLAITPGAALTRVAFARTLNAATTRTCQCYFSFGYTNGQAIDMTIEFGWPQLVRRLNAYPPVRTTGVAAKGPRHSYG